MKEGFIKIVFSLTDEFGNKSVLKEEVEVAVVDEMNDNRVAYLTERFKAFLIAATYNEKTVNKIRYDE